MEFEFEEMQREQSKLSVAVFGPSGSGKTTGCIKIAMGVRDQLYPGESLKDIGLFIDTEKRSSTKAVGRSVGGETLEALTLYHFEPPYDIVKLANLINYAVSQGKKIIIIDSMTAFWSGKEGILERASTLDVELADKKKAYGAWSEKEIIAKKNLLKNVMVNDSAHMIFGMRAKTEYVMEVNRYGKNVPKAVGMKEDMQGDVRYEPDVFLSLDLETHGVTVVKDRIGYSEIRMTMDNPELPLDVEAGKTLAKLVAEGISPEEVAERKKNHLVNFVLSEKAHKSSKVSEFEKIQGKELTKELLQALPYEKLVKIVNYIK